MSDPYIGEIKLISFTYPPRGWAFCNGQLLPINQNQALFALLGTNFGGNGQTTFALPNLQAKVPMHLFSDQSQPGASGGEAAHTVTVAEMPTHSHMVNATSTPGDTPLPGGNVLANVGLNAYAPPNPPQPLAADTISNVGGSQAHENRSPFLALTIGICLQGIFPTNN